jgi:DNA transformation protein and related proteins
MGNLPSKDLLGLGPFSMRILRKAGISTRTQLDKIGPLAAFIAAKKIDPKVSLNLLWALAGAATDTHWTKLPRDYRSTLLLEYDAYCDQQRQAAGDARRKAAPRARR